MCVSPRATTQERTLFCGVVVAFWAMAPPSTPSPSSRKRPLVPLRDTTKLYVHPTTLQCAQNCRVCAYKIACFDVALDKEFTQPLPNQRPETCPRLRSVNGSVSNNANVGASNDNHDATACLLNVDIDNDKARTARHILTVGDGDFSFSVAVARTLQKDRHHRHCLTATSYESRATLERVYRLETLQSHWNELQQAGAALRFKVDATHLPPDLQAMQWDVVVWNFPCTAVDQGQDGQNQAMEDNKELVRQFCRRVPAHEIHLAHKTKPPYDQWGLVDVVTSGGDWKYVGRIVLDRALWQPYVPRKAKDAKSFPCHDACTYVFQRAKEGEVAEEESEPTWLDKKLIPVTEDLVLELRESWLQKSSTGSKVEEATKVSKGWTGWKKRRRG